MRPFSTAPRAFATALLVAVAPAEAAGEPGPGRIDFLDSPAVIGGGRWQFDPVFPQLPGPHDGTAPHFAQLALPVNASQTMELRAATANPAVELPLESANDRLRRLHGFSDVSLGAQWRVRGGDAGWLPHVAWLADVETTMGSPAFRDGNVRPSLRATAQWALPKDMTLGVMPGLYRDRGDDGRHYAAGVLAVTLGKSWTPRLQSFVELAGQTLSRSQSDASLLNVDTGVAFAASKALQVDMVVSRSLSGGASQQVRGGLSVSSRF
ncbi:transporter [Scleromatobacter humisilvae]|uniref:Transporter n=1 Tax=Scleromatobacter humisilvae TaxID=2897159 RepID=A0A9X1YGF0_9BURK|nr:transporter [Scleromatobacter humisilvae]MCK9685568.1 transporter [Scleromatobacter humisilvae]